MAVDLRPASLDDLGLVPALQSYADKYSQAWPIQVKVEVHGLKRRLPRDVELVLYRVAQEALTNIGKHAGATRADVRLSRRRNRVELVIEDNGRGFEVGKARAADGSGLGLFGMRERLGLVNGELEVRSSPDSGTSIRARVPLNSESPARRAR
jgi:signal transduction histidine kinase